MLANFQGKHWIVLTSIVTISTIAMLPQVSWLISHVVQIYHADGVWCIKDNEQWLYGDSCTPQ